MIGSFDFFGREISSYMLCAFVGIMATGVFAFIKAKKNNLNEVMMTFMLMSSVVGVLIGGHLLFAVTNLDKLWLFGKAKSFGDFIAVASVIFGGQVFYGGLFGGIGAALIFAKITRLENFSGYTDIMAAGVPLFHVFGRIGCFLGGCCYGVESDFGFTFHNSLAYGANGVNRFPVQLFEAGFCLLITVFILRLSGCEKLKGRLFYIYLFTYAIGRFILEFFRGDNYRGFLLGLSTSQIISVVIIMLILFYFFFAKRKIGKRENKPEI